VCVCRCGVTLLSCVYRCGWIFHEPRL